jgi:fatty acid desaturase
MGLPVVSGHDNPWLHQLASTRDFQMPRAMSWFFMGLDHQVEHHLFSRIPHQHLPRAREITRAWCERTGAPFQIIGFAAGVADVTRHLGSCWQIATEGPEAAAPVVLTVPAPAQPAACGTMLASG